MERIGSLEKAKVVEKIVQIKSLIKKYKNIDAVKAIDLDVHVGEIYGLIGPDGAGKSSILKIISGVLTYDQGDISVFGRSMDTNSNVEFVKNKIGFMPQGLGLNLYPDLSVEENIRFFGKLRLLTDEELERRSQEFLEITRLAKFKDRAMKNLSGGMKQKLGLICSIIHLPELIILDEPTTGVDPVSRRDFWNILNLLIKEKGMSAVVSTAYMDEADRFNRISLLNKGVELLKGKPEEVKEQVPGRVVNVIPVETRESELDVLINKKFQQVTRQGHQFQIYIDDNDDDKALSLVISELGKNNIQNIECSIPGLEDSFIALMRTKEKEQLTLASTHLDLVEKSEGEKPLDIAIEAINLTKIYGSFKANDAINFKVKTGEIFGLLGANGAGKTTTIKMLTGILPPSDGVGRVAGVDIKKASLDLKNKIGYVSQSFSLYPDLSTLENLRLYASIYGLRGSRRNQRIEEVISLLQLSDFEKNLTKDLPMGIRQRLAIACAILHGPRVLFLDEPTSGVDPVGRHQLWEIIYNLSRKEYVTVLITTHYMGEAEFCDHITLMYSGRVVEDNSPQSLKEKMQSKYGDILEIEAENIYRCYDVLKEKFKDLYLQGNKVRLITKESEQGQSLIRELLSQHSLNLKKINKVSYTMEDVFVQRVLELERQGIEHV